uniref:Putative secreted protein n=1 Tax=Anopheles darlingi TaxID=43151 RepID=A0A2M4D8H4_ANODA
MLFHIRIVTLDRFGFAYVWLMPTHTDTLSPSQVLGGTDRKPLHNVFKLFWRAENSLLLFSALKPDSLAC